MAQQTITSGSNVYWETIKDYLNDNFDELYAAVAAVTTGFTWSVVSTNTTMVTANGYLVDCSGGAITMTLPVSPSAGDYISIVDLGDSETNNITIDRNGEPIMGAASNKTIASNSYGLTLVYANDTKGWVITSEVNTVVW